MMFEYRAEYADGHVGLVSDTTPTLARDRARRTYPASPLARMVDGWGSIKWDAERDPRRYQAGWSARETVTHAACAPGRALCGVRLKHVTRGRAGGAKFEPAAPGTCRTCTREARR